MINSMSELLLLARGEAIAIMPFLSAINPKLYEKTWYWLLIVNLAKLTVHSNKYEYVWDCQVCSIQVYSTLDTLQQIVATYKSLTNQWAITLFHCCSANQWAITFFTVYMCKKIMLQHYLAYISLLLVEL